MEDLIKDHFPVPESAAVSDTVAPPSLSYEECKALRYTIGYVIRSLMKKLTRSAHPQKEELILCLRELIVESGRSNYMYLHLSHITVVDIDDSEELDRQSDDWTILMDRGSLYHVSDDTFQLFITMELELRQCLSKIHSSVIKDTAVEKILKNDDIFDQWYDISVNWGDESDDLLQIIAEHWIMIRGFSHAGAFMETYKKKHSKSIEKSKGIRKNLISQTH